ncbi:hypothetical protein [Thermococcus sp.]
MHPLESAMKVKGGNRFSRRELIGLLSFTLRLMSPSEAKTSIGKWIEEGLLVEEKGELVVVEEKLGEAQDVFEEMLDYVSSQLGWSKEETLEEAERLSERYGNLDVKLLLYLLGLDRGLDMSAFRDRLEL